MKLCRFLLGFVFLVSATVGAFAQSTSASLTGFADDPSKALIPGVQITAINTQTGVKSSTVTNRSGQYVLPGLIPGTYRLEVDKQGFKGIVEAGVVLHVQDVLQINFHMAIGSTSETVTVKAGALNINTTDGSVSTVIDRQFVKNIPLNGRSFQSLILLTPGVTAVPGASNGGQGEFSVNGQRTETNYYTVDGVSANTGIASIATVGGTPAETALGTTQSLVSLDALQEFRISTSSYSAEFGRSPGAQIAFDTRSGTNVWHGTLFDYFRNAVLDANNWFNDNAALSKPAEKQNDFGGVLGGPIEIPRLYNGKDKSFFFFSYEGLRVTIPQPASTTEVPDTALRENAPVALRPIVNAFPIQNGAEQGNGLALFTGSYSSPSSLDAYSLRIDQAFGGKFRVFGRYADTPSNTSSRLAGNNLANLEDITSNIKSATFGVTSLFSSRESNDFRFNYTSNVNGQRYSSDNFGGATPLTIGQALPGIAPPKYYNVEANLLFGLFPGVTLTNISLPSHQWNVVDSETSTLGPHTLKYGIDYRRQEATQGADQFVVDYLYFSASSVLANSADSAQVLTFGNPPAVGIVTNFSAFVQDEWRFTDRLHLSLGLRWDLNPPPRAATSPQPYTLDQITDLATAKLAPAGTPVWTTDYLGFAPRIGVAYQLHQNPGHQTVLRGGFGVFYDVGNYLGLYGLFGGVGIGQNAVFPGAAFPLTPAQLTLPPPSIAPPYNGFLNAPDPHLRLPYTLQYNAAIEQGLGSNQALTISYVAAGGRKLLFSQTILPSPGFNPNFGPGLDLSLLINGSGSDYNSLQVQFQRQLSRGLQALASYTWSHSIDNLSSNQVFSAYLVRGNSDFDVRNSFTAALTYTTPSSYANAFKAALLKDWNVDVRQTAQSALPVDIFSGFVILPDGRYVDVRPNLVPGAPIYIHNSLAPGRRVINFNAFSVPAVATLGDAPRNFVRGFDVWQTDLAIQRQFPIHERLKLQFRAEAFNIFNHPNFGTINNTLTDGPNLFGVASTTLNSSLGGLNPLYQLGGPRSGQLALKFIF